MLPSYALFSCSFVMLHARCYLISILISNMFYNIVIIQSILIWTLDNISIESYLNNFFSSLKILDMQLNQSLHDISLLTKFCRFFNPHVAKKRHQAFSQDLILWILTIWSDFGLTLCFRRDTSTPTTSMGYPRLHSLRLQNLPTLPRWPHLHLPHQLPHWLTLAENQHACKGVSCWETWCYPGSSGESGLD